MGAAVRRFPGSVVRGHWRGSAIDTTGAEGVILKHGGAHGGSTWLFVKDGTLQYDTTSSDEVEQQLSSSDACPGQAHARCLPSRIRAPVEGSHTPLGGRRALTSMTPRGVAFGRENPPGRSASPARPSASVRTPDAGLARVQGTVPVTGGTRSGEVDGRVTVRIGNASWHEHSRKDDEARWVARAGLAFLWRGCVPNPAMVRRSPPLLGATARRRLSRRRPSRRKRPTRRGRRRPPRRAPWKPNTMACSQPIKRACG